ncbi:KTSC domain-containing protein [Chamaesiphon sp. GL140_3_metabinner_50]|uniref:KTSC domain-containing protein n=1 Tax=Chamaesiphon sp. GL140_3_metabinner_50 TaxID=2970812 RepID=UPI0025E32BF3|nr:KTSC domain-containing protein [Chamaesiphon sp. GL140_3_metabinner_50]
MKLSKIDLSSLRAIAHDDNGLKLLIERENEIEYIEIPAPLAAYEGLQLLDRIMASTPAIAPSEEIEMLPACSSMAAQVGYDEEREILQIEFNSGAVYQYSHVEPELWEDLQSTDSIGSFYNHEIKGYYPSQQIE